MVDRYSTKFLKDVLRRYTLKYAVPGVLVVVAGATTYVSRDNFSRSYPPLFFPLFVRAV